MKKSGAEIVWEMFQREDVDVTFGIPGGAIMHMYHPRQNYGVHHVLMRHEQCAAHAADAWARLTNTPGVCFGTVGPGAMHLVPGVGAAWADNIPVIAIVPQVDIALEDTFTLQGGLDQVALFKPITKYQKSIH